MEEKPPDVAEQQALQDTIRDLKIESAGQKEILDTYKKRFEEIAQLLGVSDDFAVIKGEITKLILIEDDREVLKGQIKTIKDAEGNEVGKVFSSMKKEVDKYKQIAENMVTNVKTLKAKRNVDKYPPSELFCVAVKKWLRNIFGFIPRTGQRVSQFVSLKIFRRKGGEKKDVSNRT